MPKVRRTPPPTHLVVVDTNILWDKDKKLPVSQAFDEFWRKNSPEIPMELFVPDVVFGELHFQQATSALKALSSINDGFAELSGITSANYAHKCNEATVRAQVHNKLEKWLRGQAGKLLPTPIASVNWKEVVDSAIWRKPPFTFDPKDKSNEKGFRDAVILETLVHFAGSAPSNATVIFVCNDYLLRTTAEARLKSSKKMLAFESLADFEAYIRLTKQQFTASFVKSIQSHARAKFFTKGDPNCIYMKHDLSTRFLNEFSSDLDLMESEPVQQGLLSIGKPKPDRKFVKQRFWIRATQFSRLEGERQFHWNSHVNVVRLYQVEGQGLIGSAMLPTQRIQVVGFDVKWKANVKLDGRFHDIQLDGIERAERQVVDASSENIAFWRLDQ